MTHKNSPPEAPIRKLLNYPLLRTFRLYHDEQNYTLELSRAQTSGFVCKIRKERIPSNGTICRFTSSGVEFDDESMQWRVTGVQQSHLPRFHELGWQPLEPKEIAVTSDMPDLDFPRMIILPLEDWDENNHLLKVLRRGKRTLEVGLGTLELYFVDSPPALAIRAPTSTEQPALKHHLNAVVLLLSWLCGLRKPAGFSIEAAKSSDGKNAIVWKQGIHEIGQTSWRPVPQTYSDWVNASAMFRPADSHIEWLNEVLSEAFLSRAVDALVSNRRLVYAVEYTALAAQLPVDASGVMLQIVIESLKPQTGPSTKIVEDSGAWARIRKDLMAEAKASIERELSQMSDAERELVARALSNKIEGLNRKSNAVQLLATFQAADVPLSEAESRMIKRRDPYIHDGGLLVGKEKLTHEAFITHHLDEHSLLTAVHKLLLRLLGYHGPFLDWGKYDEHRRSRGDIQFGLLAPRRE